MTMLRYPFIGVRVSSGLIAIVAAATTTALYTLSAQRADRAVIRKIAWHNHQAANNILQIGYDTLGAVWTPVLPDIQMLANMDGQLDEWELPIVGNMAQGFAIDTTPVTGFAGVIAAQAVAAGAAPNDVEVTIEIELY